MQSETRIIQYKNHIGCETVTMTVSHRKSALTIAPFPENVPYNSGRNGHKNDTITIWST